MWCATVWMEPVWTDDKHEAALKAAFDEAAGARGGAAETLTRLLAEEVDRRISAYNARGQGGGSQGGLSRRARLWARGDGGGGGGDDGGGGGASGGGDGGRGGTGG